MTAVNKNPTGPAGGNLSGNYPNPLVKNQMPVFNVKDTAFGAIGDGVADDTTAFVNAHAQAVAVGGAIIYMPKGTYKLATSAGSANTISAAPNLAARIVWRGAGIGVTILKTTSPVASFQTCAPDTSVPTFKNYAFEDFTLNTAASSKANKGQLVHYGFSAGGNVADLGRHEFTRVAIQGGGNSTGQERDFVTVTYNRNTTSIATRTCSHWYFTDCFAGISGGGGNYGIVLAGFVSGASGVKDSQSRFYPASTQSLPNPANCVFENIYIHNFHHDTGQTPLVANGGPGGAGVGIQLGGDGVTKHARIWGGSLNNESDVGIEIDNAWDVEIDGVTVRNPNNSAILVIPYGAGAGMQQSNVRVHNCTGVWEDTDTSGNPITQWAPTQGISVNSRFGTVNGNVTIRDCEMKILGGWSQPFAGGAAYIIGPSRVATVSNCSAKIIGSSVANNGGKNIQCMSVTNGGARMMLNIDNFSTHVEGTADNTDITVNGITFASAAFLRLNLRGMTSFTNVVPVNAGTLTHRMLNLGVAQTSQAEPFASDTLIGVASFDAGAASNYTFTTNHYVASANLTTENRFLYWGTNTTTTASSLVGTVQDGASYAKLTTGASLTGYKAGAVGKRSAASTYLDGYVYDNGTATFLCLDKVVAGTRSSLLPGAGTAATGANFSGGSMTVATYTSTADTSGLGVQLSTRLSTSTAYWPRLLVQGDTVYMEHFPAAPGNIFTRPTTTGAYVTVTLTLNSTDSKNFGALSPLGLFGISHIPVDAAAQLDDLTHQRGHVMSGSIQNLQPLAFQNAVSGSTGVYYQPGSSSGIRISDRLRVRYSDFSTLGPATSVKEFDILSTDTAFLSRLHTEGNHYFTPPVGTAITVSASPFTYQNLDGVRERVGVYAGTVSAINLVDPQANSTQIANATGHVVLLEPGESLVTTYSSAPTMTKVPVR